MVLGSGLDSLPAAPTTRNMQTSALSSVVHQKSAHKNYVVQKQSSVRKPFNPRQDSLSVLDYEAAQHQWCDRRLYSSLEFQNRGSDLGDSNKLLPKLGRHASNLDTSDEYALKQLIDPVRRSHQAGALLGSSTSHKKQLRMRATLGSQQLSPF